MNRRLLKCALLFLSGFLSAPGAQMDREYIDSKLCAGCHAQIYKTYRRTGMARSFYRPQPDHTVEDFTKNNHFYHRASDTHYLMLHRDGKYYQRRWQIGFGGKETNVEEMEIDSVMGSGNHARTYLHRTSRRTLIELPLGWYAEKGGYWAMNPGYDTRHPATRRKISYECMFCHNAYPHIPAGHDQPASEPVFPEEMPEGIDCQRCHGPGAKHVQAAEVAGTKPEDIRKTIVNPARLSVDRQMEVCLQCHLETTSTRLPSLIRRFDRGPFSYSPGEPLGDFVISFDHVPGSGHDDKFEIVSSAYRIRKSECFLKSNGALTCETCHDPHNIPRGQEGVKHYAGVCLKCHTAELDRLVASGKHPAAADCVSCHMPKRRTDDVVHAVMTDHLIQRRMPARNLLANLSENHPTEAKEYHGEVVPYYPSPLPPTGENALYVAVAQVAQKSNLSQGIAQLTAEIEKQHPRLAEFYMALGNALYQSGQADKAAAAYERAARLKPDSARVLRNLGIALKKSGQPLRSAEVLNLAVQLPLDGSESWYTLESWYELGLLDSQQGRKAEAIAKIEKAIALDPDLLEAYNSLGVDLFETGNMDRAETVFRDALRIDPYDATGHRDLARLLVSKRNLRQAVYHFEKAAHLRWNYAPNLYEYGLALVQMGHFGEAQQQAEAAVRANPNLAEAHELLGSLLARKKQIGAALHEYQEAVRIQPDFSRAQLDLGVLLAEKGDLAGAVQHLRQAANGSDPEVTQQAVRALQHIGDKY